MENTALRLGAEKEFNVTVEELYKAWITPEALKEWWQPLGSTLKNIELDVKEGGAIKYEFEGKDGQTSLVITGEYHEVKENKKLAYSWNWNVPESEIKEAEHELTVLFVTNGDGSQIKVTQENFENEESINPHQEGWNKALNDLQDYLNK